MPAYALRTLDAELKEKEKHFRETRQGIIDRKIAVIRRYAIVCVHCKKQSVLSRWIFLQDFWYTQPSGCTEGDYWNKTESECCHIFCPQCEKLNYIYNHPQKALLLERIDDRDIGKEKLFAEVWEQHGDNKPKRVHPKS